MFGKYIRNLSFVLAGLVGVAGLADAQQGYDAGQRARVNPAAAYSLISNAAVSGAIIPGVSGGAYLIDARGTFGGTSIAIQDTLADGTFQTVTTITAAGSYGPFIVPALSSLKAVVTGGAPSGLYVSARGIGPGSSSLSPLIPAENFNLVADGVCTPAGNPTSCTGTDNTPALTAMFTKLCAQGNVQTKHMATGRTISFKGSNYYFATSWPALTCSNVVLVGQVWGGTIFSAPAGVNFLQTDTFSTTPTGFSTSANAFTGVYSVTFSEPANSGSAETRTGTAIQDNGAGSMTVQDVHCYQMQYCFNAPYGGQLDTVRRLFVEYTDWGIYCGPNCNQTNFEDTHMQFTWKCVTLEGGSHILFSGITDLNSCGAPTGDTTGYAIDNVANQSTTLQGVWICPGSGGSATGCGGYDIDESVDIQSLWLESNNGGLGYSPAKQIMFEGNYGDAIRGFRVHSGQWQMGGTLLAGSALVDGSGATNAPQNIQIENVTYNNTYYANLFKSVSRSFCKNIRAQSGTSAIGFGSGIANTGCETTPGVAYTALTPGTTVATDAGFTSSFTLAPVQSFTLSNPTNLAVGKTYIWRITQDGTGTRVATYASQFKFPGGAAGGVLSVTAGAIDQITCAYDGTNLNCTLAKALA